MSEVIAAGVETEYGIPEGRGVGGEDGGGGGTPSATTAARSAIVSPHMP